jgi:hypothetical protein
LRTTGLGLKHQTRRYITKCSESGKKK